MAHMNTTHRSVSFSGRSETGLSITVDTLDGVHITLTDSGEQPRTYTMDADAWRNLSGLVDLMLTQMKQKKQGPTFP